MKKRFVRSTLAILAFTAITAILSAGAALADQTWASIDRVRQDFNAAFNAGDAAAMSRIVDRDGIWMPPGNPAIKGKEDIVETYAAWFAKFSSKINLKSGEVLLTGQWAVVNGTFERTDTLKSDGARKQTKGHYLLILKKQSNGAWKIARDIWNEGMTP